MPQEIIRREKKEKVKATHMDAYRPVLLESPRLEASQEQLHYIAEILRVSCSDSRFAQKAYAAIERVLSNPDPELYPPPEPEAKAMQLPTPVPYYGVREEEEKRASDEFKRQEALDKNLVGKK